MNPNGTYTTDEILAMSDDAAKNAIRRSILLSDAWLKRAVCAIYERQTADERANNDAKHDNGVGFNHADAKKLSKVARWFVNGCTVRRAEMDDARKRMMKYAGQLLEIARRNAREKAAAEATSTIGATSP